MRMSISTTSGRSVRAASRASSPSAGLADDVDLRFGVEDHAEARPHQGLVVDDQNTNGHARTRAASGSARAPEAAVGPGPGLELGRRRRRHARGCRRGALPGPAGRCRPRPRARAHPARSAHARARGLPAGAATRSEALLENPVGREVEARGKVDWVAVDAEIDLEARVPGLLDEPVEVVQPRSGGTRRGVVAVSEHAEHAPHLGQRLASDPLDHEERLALALLVRRQEPPHSRGLHDHHADRVRDHVVQLAGDPRSLVCDGLGCESLALLLGALRALAKPRRLQRCASRSRSRRSTRC